MAFDNYFITVDGERINFTSGFSTNLQHVLDDIDTNFKRILSAPFIQGDSGNSVIRTEVNLYEEGEETFTDFGKAFVKSLYNDDDLSTAIDGSLTFTFTDLVHYIDGHLQDSDITDGVYSCEYINPDPTDPNSPHITSVDCYMIENTISKTFVPIVFFVDLRIAVMQGNSEAWGEDFIDRSCVLYGACDEQEDWDIKRYQVMPTLYFDSNIQQWCWALNNMETGVTAQGIQGVPGPVIPLWVAKGVRYSDVSDTSLRSNVYLAEILSTNQEIPNPTLDDVRDGDMVCVWFATDNSLSDVPQSIDAPDLEDIHNFTIGLAKRYGVVVAVKYNSDYDFGTITDDVVLRNQLNEVGYDSDIHDQGDLRGLYVGCDGKRLGQGPDSLAGIHLIHSTQENSTDVLHITPTNYEYSFSENLNNEHSAISNNTPLLCMDYSGIRSIPAQPDNSKYCYSLSNDTNSGVYTEDLVDIKDYEEYRVTLFNDDPSSRKRRGEVGLVINPNPYWDKKEYGEYVFLGGDTNNGNDQLLPGRHTYGGAGYKFDENSSIQIIKDKKDIEKFDNFYVGDCDRDMWNSLFNYAPNQIENPLASYLNLSYRRHIGLSIPSNQHELAMCFTPKVEVINESSNRKWLRIYLPTVGYMRDATPKRYYDQTLPTDIPNTYNPIKTYTTPVDNEPNWRESGGLSIKEALSHPNILEADSDLYNFYKNDPNELFLYDRVRFLVDETCGTNLPEQSFYLGKSAHGLKGTDPSTPTTEAGWEGSSAFKILSGYKPFSREDESTSPGLERRHIEAPVRGTKYNDYFDILLYDDTTMTLQGEKFYNILVSDDINNIWRSYCYANARGGYNSFNHSSYFNIIPLMKFRLEKLIELDTGGILDTYHLADELYLSSIVAKGIKKDSYADYVDTDIEFCMLFADPQVFNNGTNAPNISNNRSIIKYNDSNLVNDGNYVSLKNYVGRGNYFSSLGSRNGGTASTNYPPFWPENIQAIKNTIAINFVVKVRQTINDWYIVSIKPSSNEKDNHAEYNLGHIDSTTNFYPDRWILSNNYIINGLHDDTNSNFYESFSWWILDDLWTNTSQSIYANKNTYYQNLGLDPYKMISKDRFYMTPNDNTDGTYSVWSVDPKIDYNFSYEKYYDFYELEIGNTLFGSRPRRPQLQYLETDSFTLHDRLGNESVYNFKLNYLNKDQNWSSWNINDNGKILNSNKISAIGFTLLDFGGLISNSLSDSISMSNRSLQISQNTNSDLNSVVTQLQEDNINVNINDDSVKSRPNEIR